MNRRGLALGAAAGVCVLLVAALGAGSSATKMLRTTDGPVAQADMPDPTTAATARPAEGAGGNTPAQFGAAAGGQAAAGPGGGGRAQQSPPATPPKQAHRATPATTAAGPPVSARGVHGPLRTVGNRIVDADGQPVVLRGIQRVGFQIPGNWPAISDAEMAHARDWGANVIRLPLAETYINPACRGRYMPAYLNTLDDAVRSITSGGMVALLDLSFVTRTPCAESFRWRMADQDSIGFWRTVADRYKANPLVAFDLYNEPHDINSDQWRNGGQLVDWTTTGPIQWQAAGMQELYNAVRSTGATNVVTISGNAYGGTPIPILDGHRVDGFNIVYAMHVYTCSEPDPYGLCTSNEANQHPTVESRWTDVAASDPVMITEFGWPNRNDGSYNARVIRLAQAQNPPWGWVAFAWSGRANGDFALVADLKTYAPTPSGGPVKSALASPP